MPGRPCPHPICKIVTTCGIGKFSDTSKIRFPCNGTAPSCRNKMRSLLPSHSLNPPSYVPGIKSDFTTADNSAGSLSAIGGFTFWRAIEGEICTVHVSMISSGGEAFNFEEEISAFLSFCRDFVKKIPHKHKPPKPVVLDSGQILFVDRLSASQECGATQAGRVRRRVYFSFLPLFFFTHNPPNSPLFWLPIDALFVYSLPFLWVARRIRNWRLFQRKRNWREWNWRWRLLQFWLVSHPRKKSFFFFRGWYLLWRRRKRRR